MRNTVSALLAAAMLTFAAAPATAQQRPAKGDEAVTIVRDGQIRTSSSQGFEGFLLLIDYRGTNYTCAVTATGQVQTCYPLRW